jgi:hypothetical protein
MTSIVIVDPSFLAPTTTPSIPDSFSELTWPLRATADEPAALVRRVANKNVPITTIVMAAKSAVFDMNLTSIWLSGFQLRPFD